MTTHSIPPVGSSISVTTRYKDIYYYSDNEWKDTTYEAVVMPNEKWFKPGDFKISSDDPKMPFRVINIKNVHKLVINGEDAEVTTASGDTIKVVEVKGSKGKTYSVTIKNGQPESCTCTGFHYRRQCRHLSEALGDVDSSTQIEDNKSVVRRPSRSTRAANSVQKRGNTMSKSKTLNWNDRFALIDHFKPSDADACTALSVTAEELKTARGMLAAGTFTPTPDLDYSAYEKLFASTASAAPAADKSAAKTTRRSGSTSTSKSDKPQTATKVTPAPKKRGRKGTKIAEAFAAIPTTPTPVDAFATSHGVSLAVLRQSKRFDKSPELGAVRVKKDKESKTLMIWREAASS